MELIDDLAAARWRLQRVRLMQAAALDLEMDRQADEIEASFVNIDEPTRTTLALTKLANTERTLQLLHRYETTYSHQYHRTLTLLESRLETKLRNDPNTAPDITPDPPPAGHSPTGPLPLPHSLKFRATLSNLSPWKPPPRLSIHLLDKPA